MNRLNKRGWLFGFGLGIASSLPAGAQFDREAFQANRDQQDELLRARQAALEEERDSTLVIIDSDGNEVASLGSENRATNVVNARLSPDATRIAQLRVEDRNTNRRDLYLVDVASSDAVRLTESGAGDTLTELTWSPDSRELAILAVRDGRFNLYRRSLADQAIGDGELLFSSAAPLQLGSWSADGRYLSFISEPFLPGQRTFALDLETGGEPLVLIEGDVPVLGPRFSPDGRYQVFVSFDPTEQRLSMSVADAAPGRDEGVEIWKLPIPADTVTQNPDSLFWSPDGRELYFCDDQDRTMMFPVDTGRGDYRFEADEARPAPLPDAVTARYPDAGCYSQQPDGMHLSFVVTTKTDDQQLVVYDRDGDEVARLGEPGPWSATSFSADGTRIVAALQKPGAAVSEPTIWIFDLASGESGPISEPISLGQFAVWMPNSERIAYGAIELVEQTIFSSIYQMPADGQGASELLWRSEPDVVTSQIVDITSDGSYLAINQWAHVVSVPLAGSEPSSREEIELLVGEFDVGVARFSPNMQYVAYTYDKSGRPELYVTAFDAETGKADMSASRQISREGVAGGLSWREDGRELYYLSDRLDTEELGDFRVMAVSVDTDGAFSAEAPQTLFEITLPLSVTTAQAMAPDSTLNWRIASPDGEQFVFVLDAAGDD